MRRMRLLSLSLLLAFPAAGAVPATEPPIPPEWRTPAEVAGFRATPSYEETLAFLKKLEGRLPEMSLRFYGTSAEGRPMPLVILSKEKIFSPEGDEAGEREKGKDKDRDPEGEREKKPVVLLQNSIHAGEIDGNDACLMLLRDLALGRRRELLDAATILILPIYNVDGHERVSPWNRPNQNGPVDGMGFRTTSDGLDLNRDHMKLQSPEARALIALVNAWHPDLHVDDHVTDGVDHDWVLTYSWAESPQAPAPVGAWLAAHMPAVLAATEKAGHRVGPYVDLKDRDDPAKGFSSWVGGPRFSTAYFPLRNIPSILVETHSYKPYEARVRANLDFLVALLSEIRKDPGALHEAVAAAAARTVALGKPDAAPSEVMISWEESEPSDPIRLPLYETGRTTSVVTGQPLLTYVRGKVHEIEVPWFHRSRPTGKLARPRGYLVLPGWPQIESVLRGQGLQVEKLQSPVEIEVETMRLTAPEFAKTSYQGLTQVQAKVTRAKERRKIPAGALWIPADQPDFELAVELLEPESPDSLLSWGLLSTLFEQKEYIAPQVLEALVQEKLKDLKVAAEWREALKDETFAKDSAARSRWWYRRTAYYDERVGLLPVFRVMEAPKLSTRPWR